PIMISLRRPFRLSAYHNHEGSLSYKALSVGCLSKVTAQLGIEYCIKKPRLPVSGRRRGSRSLQQLLNLFFCHFFIRKPSNTFSLTNYLQCMHHIFHQPSYFSAECE